MLVRRRKIRRRWNNEKGGLKKKMVLDVGFVVCEKENWIWMEEDGKWERWEMNVRKKRRAGIASCLSFCLVDCSSKRTSLFSCLTA